MKNNKVKYAKSLLITSLIVSLGALVFGVYKIFTNDFLIGIAFIFGAIAMSWNDCINLFKNDK